MKKIYMIQKKISDLDDAINLQLRQFSMKVLAHHPVDELNAERVKVRQLLEARSDQVGLLNLAHIESSNTSEGL